MQKNIFKEKGDTVFMIIMVLWVIAVIGAILVQVL